MLCTIHTFLKEDIKYFQTFYHVKISNRFFSVCVSHVLEKMRKDGTGGPEWAGEPQQIRPLSHAHQSTMLKKIHTSRRMLCEGSKSTGRNAFRFYSLWPK